MTDGLIVCTQSRSTSLSLSGLYSTLDIGPYTFSCVLSQYLFLGACDIVRPCLGRLILKPVGSRLARRCRCSQFGAIGLHATLCLTSSCLRALNITNTSFPLRGRHKSLHGCRRIRRHLITADLSSARPSVKRSFWAKDTRQRSWLENPSSPRCSRNLDASKYII